MTEPSLKNRLRQVGPERSGPNGGGDVVSPDERRLASELASLLRTRLTTQGRPLSPPLSVSEADRPDAVFDDLAVDRDLDHGVRTSGSRRADWLLRAKRQRRGAQLRRAGAWIATLLIGGAVIAVATYLLITTRVSLIF